MLLLGAAVAFDCAAANQELGTSDISRAAFAQPLSFIDGEALTNFRSGADLFRLPWFADNQGRFGGLGLCPTAFPVPDATSAMAAARLLPGETSVMRSTLVRLSVPGVQANGAPILGADLWRSASTDRHLWCSGRRSSEHPLARA